jgi:hypothetical protein
MGLPFTVDQFLDVFARYHGAIWPAPLVAYALGLLVLMLAVPGSRAASVLVPTALAAMWAFVGVAYHWGFFAPVNPVARAFGALFVAEAALLVEAACRRRLRFSGRGSAGMLLGLVVVGYSVAAYPLLGLALGHAYPRAPTFGVTPCPLVLFTFGAFLFSTGMFPLRLVALPLAWSAVATSAALQLGMVEDLGLPVAGLLAFAVLWRRRRRPAPDAAPHLAPG